MHLIKCKTDSAPVYVICADCNKRLIVTDAYADLHGEPFKAFYCEDCKNIKEGRKSI